MIEFHITTTFKQVDHLSDTLFLLGANVVSLENGADESDDESDKSIWNTTILIALFEDNSFADPVTQYLTSQMKQGLLISFKQQAIEDQDWLRTCLDQFTPQPFGKRLWICPSWNTPPTPDAVNVLLDPGKAFGTGTHPTTKLCLEWLDQHIQGNETVIDYGCGSGILAIAALKLGAANVIAVDCDDDARHACQMNAQLNQISKDKLSIHSLEMKIQQQADILIANILLNPLIDLSTYFSSLVKSGGKIVLSGILHAQLSDVLPFYQSQFIMAEPVSHEGWLRLEGIKI